MKKRKGWIIILVIFLVLFGYEGANVYKNIYTEYNNPNAIIEIEEEYNSLSEEEKSEYTLDEYINMSKDTALTLGIIFGVFITLFIVIIKYILLFIFIIAGYRAMDKYYNTKLTKIDFDNNNEYYRDILKKYSVDLLGFIDHVQFNYPDVIIAMLLQLQMRGILKLDNNGIYLNNNIDLSSLSNNEKYLISKINNNKLFFNNVNEYELLVVNEGINKGLLEKKEINKEYLVKEFSVSILIYLIILIIYIYRFNSGIFEINLGINNVIVDMILSFGLGLIFLLTPIYLFVYPMYLGIKYKLFSHKIKENPYFRTKDSEEINSKLEGLKNYLKDFSKLDERETKEIILWDEYLIYSVLFGHNKKIIDEYKDLIEISLTIDPLYYKKY